MTRRWLGASAAVFAAVAGACGNASPSATHSTSTSTSIITRCDLTSNNPAPAGQGTEVQLSEATVVNETLTMTVLPAHTPLTYTVGNDEDGEFIGQGHTQLLFVL